MRRIRSRRVTRRDFLGRSALVGAGVHIAARSWAGEAAPSERLRIAGIGVGGKGASDVEGSERAAGEGSIVALCDVDEDRAGGTFKKFPQATRYRDYREMLEKEGKGLDAVIVSTPDHVHAPAAAMVLRMGKHCFCQKPLTWCIREARILRELAAEKTLATQMGNQGTSGEKFREAVDAVRAGVLGEVAEVYVWTNRPVWPQGIDAVLRQHAGVRNALHGPVAGGAAGVPARDTLAWSLWLGPAPERPYDPVFVPFKWRGWWDFGTGALGDMACHTMNLPYMALKLGAPGRVEGSVSLLNPETYPEWSKIRYEFPARDGLPPVVLHWFDGRENSPRHFAKELEGSKVSVLGKAAAEVFKGQELSGSGSLMVGTKAMLYSTDDYGNRWRILPEEAAKEYRAPEPKLPRSPGHYREWIDAIRGGPPAMSSFAYAGPLTEAVLLGTVAIRADGPLEWDAQAARFTNRDGANKLLGREYRKGWEV